MVVTKHKSTDNNVWKYVFDFNDAIAEAVMYRHGSFEERTVICISVQSGCPVGCTFCGTGKKFIRNLSSHEIVAQVRYCLLEQYIETEITNCKKFQIMFMSMGEPLLNFAAVKRSIIDLNDKYPNADLLISTMAPYRKKEFDELFWLSSVISKVGLQFSIHDAYDSRRDVLIPYKNKYKLREIRDIGIEWYKHVSRQPYINYCISEENSTYVEFDRIKDLFPPNVFALTFSVICSSDENMKDIGFRNLKMINEISNDFKQEGYNVRVFDPAGQDDIGGGCEQLWHVQNWLKRN